MDGALFFSVGLYSRRGCAGHHDWCPRRMPIAGEPSPSGWRTSQPCSAPGALVPTARSRSRHRLERGQRLSPAAAPRRAGQAAAAARSEEGALLLALVPKRSQSGNVIIPGRMVLDGIDTLKAPPGSSRATAWMRWQRAAQRGKDIEDVANRGEDHRAVPLRQGGAGPHNLEDCKLVWEIFDFCHLIPSPSSGLPHRSGARPGGGARWRRLPTSICHGCTAVGYVARTCPPTAGWRAPAAT